MCGCDAKIEIVGIGVGPEVSPCWTYEKALCLGKFSGRRINAFNTPKTRALAPMASASVNTAAMVKPGDFAVGVGRIAGPAAGWSWSGSGLR